MKILVAIDFSEFVDKIIIEAEKLAKTLTAKVFLLHVLPPISPIIDVPPDAETLKPPELPFEIDNFPALSDAEAAKLLTITEKLQSSGIDTTIIMAHNDEIDAIIDESNKNNVDMIMLGSHGHGALYHLMIGSVSEGVIRRSTCPVIIVPFKSEVKTS
jgi:nucleotide-binding universal stress UspA family protein